MHNGTGFLMHPGGRSVVKAIQATALTLAMASAPGFALGQERGTMITEAQFSKSVPRRNGGSEITAPASAPASPWR